MEGRLSPVRRVGKETKKAGHIQASGRVNSLISR